MDYEKEENIDIRKILGKKFNKAKGSEDLSNVESEDFISDVEEPEDFVNIDEPKEESRSTWGSDFSNIEEPEEIITNDKGETFIISKERRKQIRKNLNIKFTEDFFVNILELDNIYADINFIEHLLDTNILSIERNLSDTGLISDYTIKYYGGEFETIGRVLALEEMNLLRENIMNEYDNYNSRIRNKKIKKGGIITAIAITIAGLISKWEKLKPSEPVKHIIPWTELRDVSGKTLIFTGKYFTVILLGTLGYLVIKKRTKGR